MFAMSVGLGDVMRAKARVILLWIATVIATGSALLSAIIWQDATAINDQMAALHRQDGVLFQIVHPDPNSSVDMTWPGSPLDTILRDSLTPMGTAASALVGSYPASPEYAGRVIVAIGYWSTYASSAQGTEGILVGSDVTDLNLSDQVNLGPHTETVIGRLPKGSTLLASTSAWAVPTDLSNSLLFLTSYSHFVDTVAPGYAHETGSLVEPLLIHLRVYDWTDDQIDACVDAAALSGGFRLLPRTPSEEAGVWAMKAGAATMSFVAAGLVGLSLVAFAAVMSHAMASTFASHGVHRLYGAAAREIRTRSAAFVFTAFSVPACAIVAACSLLPIPQLATLRSYLWLVDAVLVMISATVVELACRRIMKDALLLATRGFE